MSTAPTITAAEEREALRRKLAKEAATFEASQAEVKSSAERLRAYDEEEKRRRLKADEGRKALHKLRGQVLGKAQQAANALERLRQEFVPLEVRHALSAAKRDVDQAKLKIQHAEHDAAGARQALAEIKDRIAKVPSGASRADLQATVKRAEEDCAAPAARADVARAELEAAKVRLERAQAAYDAAMAAARAL